MMKKNVVCLAAAIVLSGGAGVACGQVLNEDIKLTANDGANTDWFGYSISIDNGIVAVGARRDDDQGGDSGSAFLFDASTGVQIAKLTASDGRANDQFGHSISIDNGILAVGAYLDDDDGGNSGSAYLFDADPLSPTFGTQLYKLTASDGTVEDRFGYSIAIDSGIVAVGAWADDDHGTDSGSVYLFDASTGVQIAKLTPSDGRANDQFGHSISIDNGIVAIGAQLDDDRGANSGSAYLFDAEPLSPTFGTQLHKLVPSDGALFDNFGQSIAIDDGIVAVGAQSDDDDGFDSGSAYLFDVSTGVQIAKLTASDGVGGDNFGWSIAIDSGIVGVGSYLDDDHGSNSGSAYLFDASTGVQLAKLAAGNGGAGDEFGWSMAIDNGIVGVGARLTNDHGSDSGSAYVFDVACPADLNNDFTLNFFDVSRFLELFGDGDLAVDFNGDGMFNFFDVSIFIVEFGQGCPLSN